VHISPKKSGAKSIFPLKKISFVKKAILNVSSGIEKNVWEMLLIKNLFNFYNLELQSN
jgi:hypothetical protein